MLGKNKGTGELDKYTEKKGRTTYKLDKEEIGELLNDLGQRIGGSDEIGYGELTDVIKYTLSDDFILNTTTQSISTEGGKIDGKLHTKFELNYGDRIIYFTTPIGVGLGVNGEKLLDDIQKSAQAIGGYLNYNKTNGEGTLEIAVATFNYNNFVGYTNEVRDFILNEYTDDNTIGKIVKEKKDVKVSEFLSELSKHNVENGNYDCYSNLKNMLMRGEKLGSYKYTLDKGYLSKLEIEGFKTVTLIKYNNALKMTIDYKTGNYELDIECISFEGLKTIMSKLEVDEDLVKNLSIGKIDLKLDDIKKGYQGVTIKDGSQQGLLGVLTKKGSIYKFEEYNTIVELSLDVDNMIRDVISVIEKECNGFANKLSRSSGREYVRYINNSSSLDDYFAGLTTLSKRVQFENYPTSKRVEISRFECLSLIERLIEEGDAFKDKKIRAYEDLYNDISNSNKGSYFIDRSESKIIIDEIYIEELQFYIWLDYYTGRIGFIDALTVCSANDDILYKHDILREQLKEEEAEFIRSVINTKGLGNVRFYGGDGNDSYEWYTLELDVDTYSLSKIASVAKRWANYNDKIGKILDDLDTMVTTVSKDKKYNKLTEVNSEEWFNRLKIVGGLEELIGTALLLKGYYYGIDDTREILVIDSDIKGVSSITTIGYNTGVVGIKLDVYSYEDYAKISKKEWVAKEQDLVNEVKNLGSVINVNLNGVIEENGDYTIQGLKAQMKVDGSTNILKIIDIVKRYNNTFKSYLDNTMDNTIRNEIKLFGKY